MANRNIPILSLNDNDVFIMTKLLSKQLHFYQHTQLLPEFLRYCRALRAVAGLGYTAIITANSCDEANMIYHDLLHDLLQLLDQYLKAPSGISVDLQKITEHFTAMLVLVMHSFFVIDFPLYFDAFRNNLCIALGGLRASECDCCNMDELSRIFNVVCKH